MSCSIHSAFWWVIKIGSSSICVFSFWRCCEFMAGFHLRLFCSYLITDVSFCLTSHCFFFWSWDLSVIVSRGLALLMVEYGSFCIWDHLVQWWFNFKIFGTCSEKALQDMAASSVPYSLSWSFSFTFEFPIMWSMCVDYVFGMKWIGKLSYLPMEFSSLKCSSVSFIPVQEGEIYNRY